jgi:ABC-type Fe3+ transport system substrate-binding protein
LMKRNLIRKINLSDVMDVDPANVYLDGRLYQEDNKVTVIGYNTNLIPPADVPKTWEDLLNPKWKGGKMFFTQQGLSLSPLWAEWGEIKTTEYLKKLKEQEVVITVSPRPGSDKLANSEAYLADTFASTLYTVLKAGAPVAISPISPQMVFVAGTYAMENSPHPNAAKLWVAWSQTPEARAARWEYIGEAMAKPPESTAVGKLIQEKNLKLWYVSTPEIAAMRGENQTKTQKLLGIVQK